MRYTPCETMDFVTHWGSGRGFYGLFEQIPCYNNSPTYRPDDVSTTTSVTTTSAITSSSTTTTKKPNCDRDTMDKTFRIEIDKGFETCSINVYKSSQVNIT